MPQVISIVSESAVVADELDEMFDAFTSDGVLTAQEIEQLDDKVEENKIVSVKAELAYQWGMAVLKGGINGKRAKELETENTHFDNHFPAA